jgi:hypothetical protein
MITIKDKALGKYSVVEDFQGLKVIGEDGKTLVKVNAFEEALRYIASRLILDYDATYTLGEYTRKKKEVYDSIVAAQEGVHQEEIPFEEVNG